ncbi:MAG: energy transducer TonB [Pseudomonadales bacterium]|nr:energy transducer TonB [Pseudomonadales bacterium]
MKRHIASSLLLAATLSGTTQAQDTTSSYQAPEPIELRAIYAESAIRAGAEGWVLVHFMVGIDGKVFEPRIVGSSGPEMFQFAALRALDESTFKPATVGGEAVEGRSSINFRFLLIDGDKAAGTRFGRLYRNLSTLIESGNKDEAQSLLVTMNKRGALNNYEGALLALANYMYLGSFSEDIEGQVTYLNQALMYEAYAPELDDSEGYLPEDLANTARLDLLTLLIKTKRYAEALNVYRQLQESGIDTQVFAPAIAQIQKIRSDSSAYRVQARTDTNGSWQIQLFKPGIFIDSSGQSVNEFGLWCEKKYQFFTFQEGNEYQIPESWGNCTLIVMGSPEATFELEQFGLQ